MLVLCTALALGGEWPQRRGRRIAARGGAVAHAEWPGLSFPRQDARRAH